MSTLGSPSNPRLVYLLGDSNVCSLADRVYRAASGASYLFRALYVPGLRAAEFIAPGGGLGARVGAALEAERLLVRHGEDLEAAHGTVNPHWRWIRDLEGRPISAPAIVIAVGIIDLHAISVGIAEADLALPEALHDDPRTPAICRTDSPDALDATQAVARYANALQPLRAGLRYLRTLGFSRLGVMGLCPISLDDEYVDRATENAGFPTIPRSFPTAFRYKGLLIANAVLAQTCRDENAIFVDRWSAFVGDDGLVRPGVLHDFMHLTTEASALSAAAIVAQVAARDPAAAPHLPDLEDVADDGPVDAGNVIRQTLTDPHVATVHALACARSGDRVLEVGYEPNGVAAALAADGALVTHISNGVAANDVGAGDYDIVVASDVERLAPAQAGRVYSHLAAALRPSGILIVHPARNAWRNRGSLHEPSTRPSLLRRRLSAAFPHVMVWLGDAQDDVRGSLGRSFTLAQARAATDVFAVASHRPLDPAVLLPRITTAPIELDQMHVRITEPFAPRRVARGQRFFAELTLHNESEAILSSFGPNPIRFAPIWLDENDSPVGGDQTRSPIAPATYAHESVRYAFEVTSPERTGRYTLRLAIVQEFVRWYSTSADVSVAVL